MSDGEIFDRGGGGLTCGTEPGTSGGATIMTILPLELRVTRARPIAGPVSGPIVRTEFTVNGETFTLDVDALVSLLNLLSERLGQTDMRNGDPRRREACIMHLDGPTAVSCLGLAAEIEGRTVTTIEAVGHRRRIAARAGRVHRARCP
ncbi:hypothetical protein [Aureimonas mangrovi]|uniref:hypothetical protein n=1 Tax=Aureimonas mangrovi TaxID=2758041 RepID=UPI00163D6A20|nr:hypothetical protein [Aureimonas mangrovi]